MPKNGGQKSPRPEQWFGAKAQACIDMIVAAGRKGIDTGQIAERMGSTRENVNNRLHGPKKAGVVFCRWYGSKARPSVWYAAGVEPEVEPAPKFKTTQIRDMRVSVDPNAPAIIPRGLKITRGPDFDPMRRYRCESAPSVVNAQEARPWATALAK